MAQVHQPSTQHSDSGIISRALPAQAPRWPASCPSPVSIPIEHLALQTAFKLLLLEKLTYSTKVKFSMYLVRF